jgi:RNA polymerase sigma-70 factor (ECF subfamily)
VEGEVLALFDRFRDPLLRYTGAFGLPAGETEDVVQDVFLELFKHLSRRGSRSNLHGWLYRVAHNLALKRRTRLKKHAERTVPAAAAQGVEDSGTDPERACAAIERRARLAAVLNALPVRDRHCLQLRGDGLRYRDIARVLGISLGTVAKSLARAVGRLERADER